LVTFVECFVEFDQGDKAQDGSPEAPSGPQDGSQAAFVVGGGAQVSFRL
jgi:hypothetical protein